MNEGTKKFKFFKNREKGMEMATVRVTMTIDEETLRIIDLIASSQVRSRSFLASLWLTERAKLEKEKLTRKDDN